MKRVASIVLIACLIMALGGSASPGVSQTAPAHPAPVVVADISPGVNPYHRAFRRPGWTQPPTLPGMPQPTALHLTLGTDYAGSLAADAATWAAYRNETLYWVPGTNLLLYSMRREWLPAPDGRELLFHGNGTAGMVSAVCASCWVLVLQDDRSLDGVPVTRIASEMPWIDLVVSTNYPGDATNGFLTASYATATKALYRTGRMFFAGTSNEAVNGLFVRTQGGNGLPAAALFTQYSLPSWVVSVGGAIAECGATDPQAGRPAELVGEFAPMIPRWESVDEEVRAVGVSFAAPMVAGAFADVLAEVRTTLGDTRAPGALWSGQPRGDGVLADGDLTIDELRRVAWNVAHYFEPAEFDPTCLAGSLVTVYLRTPMPVSPTPWVEMGWGFFGPTQADLAARAILDDEPVTAKPEAEVYMSVVMTGRRLAYDWR